MLEMWGGPECTVNRVGNRFFDQTMRTGHQDRIEDIERFANLGLTRIRYPVLWERVAPHDPLVCDWRWSDDRLARLRDVGLDPIVGLLHHGSGPAYTNLLDPAFPVLFADYARRAAERYPWVRDWTPINEPLTTARFSALYGLWYPHRSDERDFWTAFLNQIDGIRLAMREIRRVIPDARLVQTEDLGRSYGTAAVAHQTDYDNARRWMTWDLLSGRVDKAHPLWRRLDGFGFASRVAAIANDPTPADVIGINHYLTSDRFLDPDLAAYPPSTHGGNPFMDYADVAAIRVMSPGPGGLEGAMREAWDRYHQPLALTEVHNGCTREEQLRWLTEAWETAERLRDDGVDVLAITAWALLGSYDWCSLLTRLDARYEAGAFDLSGGAPRRTAIADEIRRRATKTGAPHPASQGAGWWRRDIRLSHRPVAAATTGPRYQWRPGPGADRRLLITGATGTLGQAFARACEARGLAYRLTDRTQLDITSDVSLDANFDKAWGVINAAGWVRVDDAELSPAACMAANAAGAARIANHCQRRGLAFASFSSDLVFPGTARQPYVEHDTPSPLNVYGRSKHSAERAILAEQPGALVVRTAAFFSPHDTHNFAVHAERALREDQVFEAAEDLIVSPTYVPDLVDTVLDLMIDGEAGIWHLTNRGAVTWAEFARAIARSLGLDERLVRGVSHQAFGWPAPRPAYAALGSTRGDLMPTLEDAIARYAQARGIEIDQHTESPLTEAAPLGLAVS